MALIMRCDRCGKESRAEYAGSTNGWMSPGVKFNDSLFGHYCTTCLTDFHNITKQWKECGKDEQAQP